MLPSASMHSRTLPAGRSAVPSSGFSTVAGRHPRGGGVQQGGLGRAGKEGKKEDGGGTGGGERKKDETREGLGHRGNGRHPLPWGPIYREGGEL